MRIKHYSHQTEPIYIDWIRRYILFHNKRHPAEIGGADLAAFPTHLAVVDKGDRTSINSPHSASRNILQKWSKRLHQLKVNCRK